MRVPVSSFLCIALGLGLAACGSRGEPARVEAGGVSFEMALDPAVPRVGENHLWLELRDAQGQPLEGGHVEARVEMPAMGAMPAMGGAARVEPLGGGRYRADFSLAMAGAWQVEVEVHPPGGGAARAAGSLSTGVAGLRLEGGAAPAAPPSGQAGHVHGAPGPPAEREPGAGHPAEFQMPLERLQRIGVRTEPVARKALASEIRATGRVVFDETALADVSLKVRGWVGELRVDAVGNRVQRGEVLFTLYSPELYAAQEELLQARRSQARAQGSGAPERADRLVAAAERRLRLWDVAPGDLAALVAGGRALEYLPIRAPASGYVIEKNVVEGGAVEPGMRLYRIAPLDRVWIEAEVYESEIPLVHEGQAASIELPYQPGQRLEGRVAWVYPTLSGGARTARLRIEVANPDLALRPDMWATVHLRAPRGEGLVVPLSAVLHAGDRSFVFLDLGDGRFRPQEVRLGLRSGEEVEVASGLEEGQRVVASGTFLIASESRLRAALEQW